MASECPQGVSYGAWLRSKNLHLGSMGGQRKYFKRWDSSLTEYESAIKQGIEPDSTQLEDVRKAVRTSEQTGVAYGS